MAGAGYKLFNTGDVLTAAQVNTYLQEQTVMVFADSAARTTALSGVLAEGMVSYLQDTNAVEVYNGSAWVGIAADQTPLTTKGDLFTFSTVDARLGVGANGTVLTADSAETTGLKWATPAAGGKVLQVVNATYSTSASNSTDTFADTNLSATITPSSATSKVLVIVSQAGLSKLSGNASSGLIINLVRGATQIVGDFSGGAGYTGASSNLRPGNASLSYLDSPNTTSATTYKTQFKNIVNAAEVIVQQDSASSSITLIEIGA